MSRRKQVGLTSLQQHVQPPTETQQIVRAKGTRGGNIVEIEYADGKESLAIMPARFIKKLWVRRGGFLLVEDSQEADVDAKITASIVAVLYEEHIKEMKKIPGAWPPEFDAEEATVAAELGPSGGIAKEWLPPAGSEGEEEEEEEEDDSLPPLEQIQNRRVVYHEVDDSDDDT